MRRHWDRCRKRPRGLARAHCQSSSGCNTSVEMFPANNPEKGLRMAVRPEPMEFQMKNSARKPFLPAPPTATLSAKETEVEANGTPTISSSELIGSSQWFSWSGHQLNFRHEYAIRYCQILLNLQVALTGADFTGVPARRNRIQGRARIRYPLRLFPSREKPPGLRAATENPASHGLNP